MVNKKRIDKKKLSIIAGLLGIYQYTRVKNYFFGSKTRTAITVSSLGLLFMYRACDTNADKIFTKVDSVINNPVREQNKQYSQDLIKARKKEKELMYYKYKEKLRADSLESIANSLKYEKELIQKKYEKKNLENLEKTISKLRKYNYELKNTIENKIVQKKYIRSEIKTRQRKKITSKKSNYKTNTTWYVAKKNESLLDIAYKIYGYFALVNKIAGENDISDIRHVLPGTPLIIDENAIKSKKEVRRDEFPDNIYILKKGQSLNKLITNTFIINETYLNDYVDEILDYNKSKGNFIKTYLVNESDRLVYIPDELVEEFNN